jgi:hypothetical protein
LFHGIDATIKSNDNGNKDSNIVTSRCKNMLELNKEKFYEVYDYTNT